MKTACDLDMYPNWANFFVQNVDDKIKIQVEKETNENEKEWRKCLKNVSVCYNGSQES